MTKELCIKCNNNAQTPNGVIYIKYQLNGKWGSHPCCQKCWDKDNPDRIAYKLKLRGVENEK